MNRIVIFLFVPFLWLTGCASMSRQSLADVNPVRTYRASVSDMFEAIKSYSLKEDFRLDRFGQEAGRVIGHKKTSSSSTREREFSVATTAMMIVMNLKLNKVTEAETQITASFAFETGHVIVTREEEAMLLECYSSLFRFLDERFTPSEGKTPG